MAKQLMKGNEAIGEAAIQAGCRYFFGYPLPPKMKCRNTCPGVCQKWAAFSCRLKAKWPPSTWSTAPPGPGPG